MTSTTSDGGLRGAGVLERASAPPVRIAAPGGQLAPSAADPALNPVRRVVLVDGRPERRAITSELVQRCAGLAVVGLAATLEEAEALIRAELADVVLLEIQLPVPQGLITVGALRAQFPELRIVVCSFHSDARTREEAKAQGADGYLTKPLDLDALLALVTNPPG